VDAVQEFKIQTNAFTSQYGWSSGNVINVVTKSGSNEFHGDAYEFYRNSKTDAKYFFNNGAQPSFSRNQFGGTVGGPIRKNKTFFFGYYEGRRQATTRNLLGHRAHRRRTETETSRLSWERRPVKLTLWKTPLSAGHGAQEGCGCRLSAGPRNTQKRRFCFLRMGPPTVPPN